MIVALFVETNGVYFNRPNVDPYDQTRDARLCTSKRPAVAHPPCERWGRFWHGSTRKPHQYNLGDDDGYARFAVEYVRANGGVIEHPQGSHMWTWFNMPTPVIGQGWSKPDQYGGRSCYVDQSHYGHDARKPTWLYAVGIDFNIPIITTRGEQIIPQWMIERYGYEKARRIGVVAMVGGKHKKAIRNRSPVKFAELLICLAMSALKS